MSAVTPTDECPSIFDTTARSAPELISDEARKWRRSCSRSSFCCRRHARSTSRVAASSQPGARSCPGVGLRPPGPDLVRQRDPLLRNRFEPAGLQVHTGPAQPAQLIPAQTGERGEDEQRIQAVSLGSVQERTPLGGFPRPDLLLRALRQPDTGRRVPGRSAPSASPLSTHPTGTRGSGGSTTGRGSAGPSPGDGRVAGRSPRWQPPGRSAPHGRNWREGKVGIVGSCRHAVRLSVRGVDYPARSILVADEEARPLRRLPVGQQGAKPAFNPPE